MANNFLRSGFVSVLGGMNAAIAPSLLHDTQYAFGLNVTSRGGLLHTRPRFKRLAAYIPRGRFQGAFVYNSIEAQYLAVVVSGVLYLIDMGSFRRIRCWQFPYTDFERAYFCQADRYLIVQNGIYSPVECWPVIMDGSAYVDNGSVQVLITTDGVANWTRLRDVTDYNSKRIPIGTYMVYGHGRLFVTVSRLWDNGLLSGSAQWLPVARNRYFVAGDVIKPDNSDEILAFTETDYLAEGGAMSLPVDSGEITGFQFFRNASTGTGAGELVVFGERGVSAFAVGASRTQWKDVSMAQVLFTQCGAASDRSLVPVNDDIVFRSEDGIRFVRYSAQQAGQASGALSNLPQSMEVGPILAWDTAFSRRMSSISLVDNRLLTTVCCDPYVGTADDISTLVNKGFVRQPDGKIIELAKAFNSVVTPGQQVMTRLSLSGPAGWYKLRSNYLYDFWSPYNAYGSDNSTTGFVYFPFGPPGTGSFAAYLNALALNSDTPMTSATGPGWYCFRGTDSLGSWRALTNYVSGTPGVYFPNGAPSGTIPKPSVLDGFVYFVPPSGAIPTYGTDVADPIEDQLLPGLTSASDYSGTAPLASSLGVASVITPPVLGAALDNRNVYNALLPLDLYVVGASGPSNTLTSRSTPAYDGLWTGLNVLQTLTVPVSGQPRAAAVCSFEPDRTEIWYLTDTEMYDGASDRPLCRIETRHDAFQQPGELKEFKYAEAWVSGLYGQVDFTLYWRPDNYSLWTRTNTITVNACETGARQQRWALRFAVPADNRYYDAATDRDTRKGHSFQFCLEWRGVATIDKVLEYVNLQPSGTPNMECLTRECVPLTASGSTGVALNHFEYQVTELDPLPDTPADGSTRANERPAYVRPDDEMRIYTSAPYQDAAGNWFVDSIAVPGGPGSVTPTYMLPPDWFKFSFPGGGGSSSSGSSRDSGSGVTLPQFGIFSWPIIDPVPTTPTQALQPQYYYFNSDGTPKSDPVPAPEEPVPEAVPESPAAGVPVVLLNGKKERACSSATRGTSFAMSIGTYKQVYRESTLNGLPALATEYEAYKWPDTSSDVQVSVQTSTGETLANGSPCTVTWDASGQGTLGGLVLSGGSGTEVTLLARVVIAGVEYRATQCVTLTDATCELGVAPESVVFDVRLVGGSAPASKTVLVTNEQTGSERAAMPWSASFADGDAWVITPSSGVIAPEDDGALITISPKSTAVAGSFSGTLQVTACKTTLSVDVSQQVFAPASFSSFGVAVDEVHSGTAHNATCSYTGTMSWSSSLRRWTVDIGHVTVTLSFDANGALACVLRKWAGRCGSRQGTVDPSSFTGPQSWVDVPYLESVADVPAISFNDSGAVTAFSIPGLSLSWWNYYDVPGCGGWCWVQHISMGVSKV